jgi:kinesin family protein C1
LADVFVAKGKKQAHVPYRNSKLTWLLQAHSQFTFVRTFVRLSVGVQPCLSANGKALMIVNLSPARESSHESLCSLRFASMVNAVELGRAKKSVSVLTASKLPPVTPVAVPR